MKKEILMNQQEWLEYFELVNGRKPSPNEMAEARATGEFVDEEPHQEVVKNLMVAQPVPRSINAQEIPTAPAVSSQEQLASFQVLPAKQGLTKKTKIILASVLGGLAALLLLVGGYALIRYQSGKIVDGTYEVVAYSYYDEDKEKMVDGLKEYEDDDIELKDFMTVEHNQSKYYSYMESDGTGSISILENDEDITQILDPWNRTQKQTLTASEYKDKMTAYIKKLKKEYSFFTDERAKETIDNAVKGFKKASKEKRTYVKNGDQFTLSFYNEDDELIARTTFKRMSNEEAEERREDYKDAVKDYKKNLRDISDLYDNSYDDDYGYSYNYDYDDDDRYSYDYKDSSDDTNSSKGDTI